MFKIITFVFMVVACVCAKPKPDLLYSAPLVAAPLATSSAVVSREFHGNTAYPYASPYYAAYSSPYVAAPYSAYASPYSAYAAPYSAYAAPYSAYTSSVLL